MFIDCFVADSCDFINEYHHISLKNLSCICKVSNIAKSKDRHDFFSRNHDIDDTWIFDNSTYNFCSRFSKTYSKQRSDLYNRILENNRFSFLDLTFLLFQFLKTQSFKLDLFDSIERINGHFFDSLHHFL